MITSVDRTNRFENLDAVANLSDQQIHDMEREELIRIIELAKIPFIDESRLPVQDTEMLQRLAFLSRQTCMHMHQV